MNKQDKGEDFQIGISDLMQQFITPRNFFGEEDAAIEWTDDPDKSANIFFHTTSYQRFKDEGALYLFGRRGTGKTAILRMLNYEIKKGKNKKFSYSYVIDQESAYKDLAIQLRGSPLADLPESELVHFLIKQWKWALSCSAMISVVEKVGHLENNDDLKKIKTYLKSKSLFAENKVAYTNGGPLFQLATLVSSELESIGYNSIKLGLAIKNIASELFSTNYEEAKQSLITFLKNNKTSCLVLIDSIEVYQLDDKISRAVTTSLIESVRQIYAERNIVNIQAKSCFPSEIYTLLTSLNQEKVEGKNLFILWQYKDLVCMLAKRHSKKFKENINLETLEELDIYGNALEYLYRHLPSEVGTLQGLSFDTLAFIIRHTQKKPRQCILILNIIYTLAEDKGVSLDQIPSEAICEGVHARLDILIKGTFDIYEQIYPKAERLIRQVLDLSPSRFKSSHLDTLISNSHSLRTEARLSVEQVKRLLLESGSIGVVAGRHSIKKTDIKLYDGLFEYQVKGLLTISNETWLVIHPMLYQEFNIKINNKDFVYPMPLEDEEKYMLSEQGIYLGGTT